jgi:hypothetical protein
MNRPAAGDLEWSSTVIVYLFCDPASQLVFLRVPVVSEGGAIKGAIVEEIHPGEDFFGYDYEALSALGNGKHELETKQDAPPKPLVPCGSLAKLP